MLRPFLAFGFLVAATGAYADPQPLTGDSLKALSGSLVEIDTPLGTKLPVRFGTDGLVSAEAGDLAPLLGSPKDRGRWWVDSDKICTKWFRWFDAEVRCITVSKDGTRLYWRKDDGETGTATLIEEIKVEDKPVVASVAPSPKTAAVKAPDTAPKKAVDKPEAQPSPPPASSTPPPQVAEAVAPAAAAASQEPAPPTVVAEAASPPASSDELPEEHHMMRFGGEGLLAASSRAGQETVEPRSEPAKAAAPAPPASSATTEAANIDDKLSPLRREGRPAKPAAPTKPAAVASAAPEAKQVPASPQPLPQASKSLEVASFEVPSGGATRTDAAPGRAGLRVSPTYRVQGVQRYDVLNVRRGPAETYAQIASIPPTGRRVEITGRCQDAWCPIRYGRVRGWVNSYYLIVESTAGSSSQSEVYLAKP